MRTPHLVDQLLSGADIESVLSQTYKDKFESGDQVVVRGSKSVMVVEGYDAETQTYRLKTPRGSFVGIFLKEDLLEVNNSTPDLETGHANTNPPAAVSGPALPLAPASQLPPISNESTRDRIKTEYAVYMGIPLSEIGSFSKVFNEYHEENPTQEWFSNQASHIIPNPFIIDSIKKKMKKLSI